MGNGYPALGEGARRVTDARADATADRPPLHIILSIFFPFA